MTDNHRQEEKGKGFWNGGPETHGSNRESGGRKSGYPGGRRPRQLGIRVDLDGAEGKPAGADPSDDGAE